MSINVPATYMPTAYVDLATLKGNPLEDKYMYSLTKSTTYFMREVRKCTPFTQIPAIHAIHSGQPAFGETFSVVVSRTGDYLTNSWLRVTIPKVTLLDTNPHGANGRIRWTKNLMHNLIEDACIYFVEIPTQRFDSFFLDFWSAFTVSASKRSGYETMIGNVDDLIRPHGPNRPLKAVTLNLPLPFFFSRDTGIALPMGALLYTETKITFKFRDWQNLLILENSNPVANQKNGGVPAVGVSIERAPVLQNVTVWGNFAITDPVERAYMGSCERDLLIEQVKYAPKQTYEPINNPNKNFDIRFSHAIKALFFGVRNITYPNVWSNWTTASPVIDDREIQFEPSGAYDPISDVTLTYESSARLQNVGADYFSHIQPYYHAPAIPECIGYHMYSYALDLMSVDPNGSTNYGRLNNITIVPNASKNAKKGAAGNGNVRSGMDHPQKYEFVVIALSQNVLNISGGTVAYPVM
uniref:Major capsid protein n=1 Tax=Rhinella marina erythrocytic-like virus TaxID=2859906 RepID=A0A8F6YI58_9VIRU|nr:major capsid protein [Rhinella marina erythrocytic-like virus]